MFEGRKVSDRIVSIDRHYVRPIVRGKETKSVEFGAKVNNIQIDGISFIEHLSFKAFNEGIRLKEASALKSHITGYKIKARNKKTEILWIFFGIHTANVILMINKIRNRTGKAA